ncbi:MAG: hypothetical protein NVSMB17_19130 [Candidatus Dormibacteria bacterium]
MSSGGTGLRTRRHVAAGIGAAIASVVLATVAARASNDELFPQQWGLSNAPASINAPQAWCASSGGPLIADIDTGSDFQHPDLAGRLVPGGRFVNGDGSNSNLDGSAAAVQDPGSGPTNGHGTMTSGIMVANRDNRIGMAGVAPASQMLVVKVFREDGGGSTTDVAAGIRWAAQRGARVINISLGTVTHVSAGGITSTTELAPDEGITRAIRDAAAAGVAVAVAAGNSGDSTTQYLSISDVALVVGALGRDGERAPYSNHGPGVNIYAPGGNDPGDTGSTALNVLSTFPGGRYADGQGTSFAAPHVAGTLALLVARGNDAAAARTAILQSAVMRNGLPELDAAAALGSSAGCATAPPAANDGGATSRGPAAVPGAPRAPGTGSQRPAAGPAPAPPGPPIANATAPSASASARPSASETAAPPSSSPVQDSMPSPRALAHPPPPAPPGPSPVAIAVGVALLGAAALGGLRLLQSVR